MTNADPAFMRRNLGRVASLSAAGPRSGDEVGVSSQVRDGPASSGAAQLADMFDPDFGYVKEFAGLGNFQRLEALKKNLQKYRTSLSETAQQGKNGPGGYGGTAPPLLSGSAGADEDDDEAGADESGSLGRRLAAQRADKDENPLFKEFAGFGTLQRLEALKKNLQKDRTSLSETAQQGKNGKLGSGQPRM
jgi:hypothetical protein